MLERKCFDRLVSPNNVVNSSYGEWNSGNFTFPPAQHIPGSSFLNLRTSQYSHILSICQITTLGWRLVIMIIMECCKIDFIVQCPPESYSAYLIGFSSFYKVLFFFRRTSLRSMYSIDFPSFITLLLYFRRTNMRSMYSIGFPSFVTMLFCFKWTDLRNAYSISFPFFCHDTVLFQMNLLETCELEQFSVLLFNSCLFIKFEMFFFRTWIVDRPISFCLGAWLHHCLKKQTHQNIMIKWLPW